MRVAVACSGLGHVRRGVEAWAEDLAEALRRRQADVTLFGAAETVSGQVSRVPCFPRTSGAARNVASFFRQLGGWRYGLGSDYEVEQLSFSCFLWRRIYFGYDILHVQDPLIGHFFDRLNRLRMSRARVIFANGTLASGTDTAIAHLRRFSAVQHLTAEAAKEWMPHRPPGQMVFTVPNFVDIATFLPGDRRAARRHFAIPDEAFVVLCCAAMNTFHKRVDYLIKEFSAYRHAHNERAILIIAGAKEQDADELIALGRELAGDSVRFLPDLARSQMPDLYRAADVFALCSLHETFGIVLLEAMASGLPVICHDAPSFRSVVGPAGMFADLRGAGELSSAFAKVTDSGCREPLAQAARPHVATNFSEVVVLDQILSMYRQVLSGSQTTETESLAL